MADVSSKYFTLRKINNLENFPDKNHKMARCSGIIKKNMSRAIIPYLFKSSCEIIIGKTCENSYRGR